MHLYICLPRYVYIDNIDIHMQIYLDICVVFQDVQTRMIPYVQITVCRNLIVDKESDLRLVSGRCETEILSKYCKNLLYLFSAYEGQTSIFGAPSIRKGKMVGSWHAFHETLQQLMAWHLLKLETGSQNRLCTLISSPELWRPQWINIVDHWREVVLSCGKPGTLLLSCHVLPAQNDV